MRMQSATKTAMGFLVRTHAVLVSIVSWVGRFGMWMVVVLAGITIFDVITRRFLVLGSTKLQEAEWHAHVILFGLCLGWAYLNDSHVRIDMVREHLKPRSRQWIELLGTLLFLLPYCVLVVWFSVEFTMTSFVIGESSNSAAGLPYRWVIKAFLPLSMGVLGLSGVAIAIRQIVLLFGTDAEIDRLATGAADKAAGTAAPGSRVK